MCPGALVCRAFDPSADGQWTKKGTRVPPSKGVAFVPRSPPLQTAGPFGPPLSLMKMERVLLHIPAADIASATWWKALSMM